MRNRKTIGGFFCALALTAVLITMIISAGILKSPDDNLKEAALNLRQADNTIWLEDTDQAEDSIWMEAASQQEAWEELSLYATAAALIDADSGRVLYGKNQDTALAMASTTKIMTCIQILENADLNDMVTVSAYAETMPKVKLYIKRGEQYQVRELLFSLMLESHNDSAVALAEHVGKQYLPEELRNKDTADFTIEESKQAVAAFAKLMNQKAQELGCTQTYFITPNGLDATETITLATGETITKEHCTTAAELARIMAYCIMESSKRDLFLEITREASYGFGQNGRNFVCSNHNAFLGMMDGALSGKTGFTNKAGYCYVGALRRDDRTFVVALLGCGWPNNKTYKWSDTMELMEYGLEHYEYHDFSPGVDISEITVNNGAAEDGNPYHGVSIPVVRREQVLPIRLLTGEGENVVARMECRKEMAAPVEEGTEVGKITYYLVDRNGEESYLNEEKLYTGGGAAEKDFRFLAEYIFRRYIL